MPRLYFPMICMIRIFISTYYYVWKNFAYQRIFQMMIQPKALYWSATLMQIHFPMGGLSPNLSNSKRKINPFSTKCFISIPPENIRKPLVFWCVQGVSKESSGMKWVNDKILLWKTSLQIRAKYFMLFVIICS